jgi:hypothetical protein
MQRTTVEKLADERSEPCVTISMNTHRTHPDNAQDSIVLKNHLKLARERIISAYGKRPVAALLERIATVEEGIDFNHGLDSLHIFLSNDTNEVIRSPWPLAADAVQVDEQFAIKPLIKALNRTEHYLVLLLSQSGVLLYHAMNDALVAEIKNEDFPFTKNLFYLTHPDKQSDGNQVDNMVREFLNGVDKAVCRVFNETAMHCVVVCTEDNYSRLMQVADKPSVYSSHVPVNYNDTSVHTILASAWEKVAEQQQQRRTDAIVEMQEAVGKGMVVTDLGEIFRAVNEGRGDLLITHDEYQQAVKMTGPDSFDLSDDVTLPGIVDDISDKIAWDVIAKKGRAIFTSQEEIKSLGDVVLKLRY